MEESDAMLAALFELHAGLERQGPGDRLFSRHILSLLPALPQNPRIADLGCGSGDGALLLADWFRCKVTAVDFSRLFLDQLEVRAETLGLAHLIDAVEADMGALDWPSGSLDLLWSEGAAYNLTFAGALTTWRPLLAAGGLAVVSELSWFAETPPDEIYDYWMNAYPAIGSEMVNAARAGRAGFDVLGIHRLPSQAWRDHYYEPLKTRIDRFAGRADEAMRQVIRETETEMDMFRRYGEYYGYAFYLLQAR